MTTNEAVRGVLARSRVPRWDTDVLCETQDAARFLHPTSWLAREAVGSAGHAIREAVAVDPMAMKREEWHEGE